MSTPSTVTATLPPHHQFYPHHQTYQPSISTYHFGSQLPYASSRTVNAQYNGYGATASSSAADLRRVLVSNSKQHQPVALVNSNFSPTNMGPARKLDRKPDWAEFYKHGIPKEVIVIDDDSPEPVISHSRMPSSNEKTRLNSMNGNSQHVDKRRRTNANSTYDSVYQQHAIYSVAPTPHYDVSPTETTNFTERTTTSVNHTTAPTSLGSQSSGTRAYMPPLDDSVVGQKRKRTRKVVAEEAKIAKKRELDAKRDPLCDYMPPPNPPIKAGDVSVTVVADTHSKDKSDDDDGHYIVTPEADLTKRYQITRLLGQGTFGKVVEAYDRHKNTKCAIKIIRSIQKYRDASRIELRVLTTLARNDQHNHNKCIHLRDCFDFRNHICIVTDLYGQSVFDFMKSNSFVPFPSTHIQGFARQLLTSVAFLHDLHLIHTDLKPENILLVNNQYQTFTYNRHIPSSSEATKRSARHRKVLLDTEIRLIDFGSATFEDEYHSSVVSTRHYRAPEIILNLGWSYPCDIWSIGCILVEFFTGDALFQTHDNLEHLAMMEAVCGAKFEREIVRSVQKQEKGQPKNLAASYFRGQKLDYPNSDTPRTSRKYVKAMKKLNDIIPLTNDFNRQFLDLLKRIFVYNPSKRITAKEALRHSWFKETLQDDGTEAAKIRLERERSQRTNIY